MASLLSFVVLNSTGRPVLEKRWRHSIPRRALDELWKTLEGGGPAAPALELADLLLVHVARGKVVAILRAKNADAAIARGVELAKLGCSALEVTLDSVDFERVLSTLVARVGDFCCVGVGTVQDAADVPRVAALGAKFALSPFNPPGMIQCPPTGVYFSHISRPESRSTQPCRSW